MTTNNEVAKLTQRVAELERRVADLEAVPGHSAELAAPRAERAAAEARDRERRDALQRLEAARQEVVATAQSVCDGLRYGAMQPTTVEQLRRGLPLLEAEIDATRTLDWPDGHKQAAQAEGTLTDGRTVIAEFDKLPTAPATPAVQAERGVALRGFRAKASALATSLPSVRTGVQHRHTTASLYLPLLRALPACERATARLREYVAADVFWVEPAAPLKLADRHIAEARELLPQIRERVPALGPEIDELLADGAATRA